jgi:hypothetical protein
LVDSAATGLALLKFTVPVKVPVVNVATGLGLPAAIVRFVTICPEILKFVVPEERVKVEL